MWYRDWFQDENYLTVYRHRDETEARATVDLFEQLVRPPAAARVLDLACGTGRHAIELARRGYHVTGVDLSPTLLDIARRQAVSERVAIRFVRDDMRRLALGESFDAVVNLFTSFGYFETDDENAKVIESVARVLVRGGCFMLDFLNAAFVIANVKSLDRTTEGETEITQVRAINNGRIEKTITLASGGDVREYFESVRLFTRDELRSMFDANGLTTVAECGDYDGSPYGIDSPRCILFGRKS